MLLINANDNPLQNPTNLSPDERRFYRPSLLPLAPLRRPKKRPTRTEAKAPVGAKRWVHPGSQSEVPFKMGLNEI